MILQYVVTFLLFNVLWRVTSKRQNSGKDSKPNHDEDDDRDDKKGNAGTMTEPSSPRGNEEATKRDTEDDDKGYWLSLDRDSEVIPLERDCFYCCQDGKTHPIEHFACYPCCNYKICLDCMSKSENLKFCGECWTKFPSDEKALFWIHQKVFFSLSRKLHLLGRVFVYGCHTYMDELMRQPLYARIPPPPIMLALLNPTDVEKGVDCLEAAAKHGGISAMLDLAEVYNTNFHNDPFQKDKKKAEYWFRRALGKGNKVFPLAFTRYGEFLKWESRLDEAKKQFMIAANFGHARGQYEYAQCLLGGLDQGVDKGENVLYPSNEEITEAIKWLCKASEKGFYIPSYTLLAKTLIHIAEKAFGRANVVGKSPLSRALQVLSLTKAGGYGDSESLQAEALELLERHDSTKLCSNCGDEGSPNNPLITCPRCGVVAYCSNICRKRDFRDGHKLDCCSRDHLFDFHTIKMTLPWISSKTGTKDGQPLLPLLKNPQERTLRQMVEDDTDEVYGEDELDYDEHILTQDMLRMRKNLEIYLNQIFRRDDHAQRDVPDSSGGVSGADAHEVRNVNLKRRIDEFARKEAIRVLVTSDFVKAMHRIRELGNDAAHREDTKLDHKECEAAVREYRRCKEDYEQCKSRIQSDSNNSDIPDRQSKQIAAEPRVKNDFQARNERTNDMTSTQGVALVSTEHEELELSGTGIATAQSETKPKAKRKSKKTGKKKK